MIKKYARCLSLLIITTTLICAGCGVKKPVSSRTEPEAVLADLKNFPQNLQVYAQRQAPEKRILSAEEQERFAAKFTDIYFGPWQMKKTSVKKKDILPFFKRARGYKADGRQWRQDEWDKLAENSALHSYPSLAQPAITLRQTDLRELPTHEIRLDKPDQNIRDYPFDYFQYALLWPGMPLLAAHVSRDGKWYYVECPIASGWVDAADIAFVDENFRAEYGKKQFAALIRDHVNIHGGKTADKANFAGIGAIFPLLNNNPGNAHAILLPLPGSGNFAKIGKSVLSGEDAVPMPMPMTAHNVARVGNEMMGQKYGWGGTLGDRDCSAMTRDLFTPFGIWLPRNSAAQARRGGVVSLTDLSPQEKAAIIMQEGVPFLSLLGMRGHIGLYVGPWHGQPAIFHNSWGLRVVKNGNDDERFVIGKAVVTSIDPGREIKELYLPVTFVDRLRTITTPGIERK